MVVLRLAELSCPATFASEELTVKPFACNTVELAANEVLTTKPFFTMKLDSAIYRFPVPEIAIFIIYNQTRIGVLGAGIMVRFLNSIGSCDLIFTW